MSAVLKNKITNRKANVAVIGLGYVGLPLAVAFAKAGFRVYGLDKDRERVEKIRRKKSYILDVPLRDILGVINAGNFSADDDFSVLRNCDVIIICVPTPIKRRYTPDISFILNAVREVSRYLKKNTLVVLESTTYPGTTQEIIAPQLEKNGLKTGRDFYLAFSPERIDPGNKKYQLQNIPKVVGGMTPRCSQLTEALYGKIVKSVHVVSSARAAEMSKLLENTFRIINVGWINEAAMMSHKMGIDIWEVIEAANTKPFGYMPFTPGLGVGGHCIPEDPIYLYWKARYHGISSKFIRLAADVNSNMPQFAVSRIKEILGRKNLKNTKLLVIGVTYKKDVKDLRKSPPLRLMELLVDEKCVVDYYDPIIPYLKIASFAQDSIRLDKSTLSRYDCVMIATDHSSVNYRLIRQHARKIFDIRNVYGKVRDKKIIRF